MKAKLADLLRRASGSWAFRLVALPLVGFVIYAVLYSVHHGFYGELGVRTEDVGLGRDELIARSLLGLIAFTLVVVVLWACLAGFALFVFWVVSMAGDWGIRRLRSSSHVRPGLRKGLDAVAGRDDSGLLKRAAQGVTLFYGLTTLVLVPVALWSIARDDAQRVRDGETVDPMRFIVPLLDIEAQQMRLVQQPEGAALPARIAECLLYLGRDDRFITTYDTRAQRPRRLPADAFAVQVLPDSDALPPRCRPEPARDHEDTLLARGRGAGELAAEGRWLAWSQRDRSGRFHLVLRGSSAIAPVAPLVAPSHRPLTLDLGPGVRPDAIDAVYRRCVERRCSIWRYDIERRRERRVAVRSAPGCTTAWPSVWGETVVVLRRGPRCAARWRGVWRVDGGRERRLSAMAGELSHDVDVRGRRVAWVDGDGVRFAVRVARFGRGAPPAFTNGLRSQGHHVTVSSPSLRPEGVVFGNTQSARENLAAETDHPHAGVAVVVGDGCRLVAEDVPGNEAPVGGGGTADVGIDAVVVDDAVVFARGGEIRRRDLEPGTVAATFREAGAASDRVCVPRAEP